MDGTDAKPVRSLRWAHLLYGLFAIGLLAFLALRDPVRYGDAFEYYYQLEALSRHYTPNIEDADIAAVNARFPLEGIDAPPRTPYGTEVAPDGRRYGIHFWGYALSAVPAKLALAATGGNERAALPVTNGLWFLTTIFAGLFLTPSLRSRRMLLLTAIGPAAWYLVYTGTEIYSWSLVMLALFAIDARRFALSGLFIGLSAWQNPATGLLGMFSLLMAIREKAWKQAALVCLAGSIALLPFVFFQIHFGKPSLIAGGFLKLSNLSAVRTWGLAMDLNQGLFPFAPLLVIGGFAGAVTLIRQCSLKGLAVILSLLGMAAVVQMQSNWNSGGLGPQRYLIWMLPLVAWLLLEGLAEWRHLGSLVITAAILQGVIALAAIPERMDYLQQNGLSRLILGRLPWIYAPDPEIFVERQLHGEFPLDDPYALPIGFARENGRVTKLLVDAGSVARLPERYQIDPGYQMIIERTVQQHPGRLYLHPPKGAVQAKPRTVAEAR